MNYRDQPVAALERALGHEEDPLDMQAAVRYYVENTENEED